MNTMGYRSMNGRTASRTIVHDEIKGVANIADYLSRQGDVVATVTTRSKSRETRPDYFALNQGTKAQKRIRQEGGMAEEKRREDVIPPEIDKETLIREQNKDRNIQNF